MEERNRYWQTLGITGWTVRTAGEQSPMYKHFKKRIAADAINGAATEQAFEVRVPRGNEQININEFILIEDE